MYLNEKKIVGVIVRTNLFQQIYAGIRDHVPIATQFFAINEKWVLVKFMKALGTFCV